MLCSILSTKALLQILFIIVLNPQIAVRAGGFSAIMVVGMAVVGVAILYSTFYVWLGVGSPGSMKVTDCECYFFLYLMVT